MDEFENLIFNAVGLNKFRAIKYLYNLYSNWEIGPFWEVKVSMFESKFIVKDLSKHKVNWLLLELLSLGLIKKNSVEISNLNYLELERKYRRLVKKRRFLRVIFRFL